MKKDLTCNKKKNNFKKYKMSKVKYVRALKKANSYYKIKTQ